MKLPNGDKAIIDERKIREYLLSTSHPVGRFKAKFFAGIGLGPEDWRSLAAAMIQIAMDGEARLVEQNQHGRKFLVVGTLAGAGGRSAEVVSVWIVRSGDDIPRLVTVYPR